MSKFLSIHQEGETFFYLLKLLKILKMNENRLKEFDKKNLF
jgi:hypothetical protein